MGVVRLSRASSVFPTPFSFFDLLLHVGVDRYALSIHGE